jgi:hypothetical protein
MDFAARFDVLLAEVPTCPGSVERFTTDDAVSAVAQVVDGDDDAQARSIARAWLAAARDAGPAPHADRPALEALASLFRVPAEYFLDEAVTQAVRQRLRLARQANRLGLRVIGPCRTQHLSPEGFAAVVGTLLERTTESG